MWWVLCNLRGGRKQALLIMRIQIYQVVSSNSSISHSMYHAKYLWTFKKQKQNSNFSKESIFNILSNYSVICQSQLDLHVVGTRYKFVHRKDKQLQVCAHESYTVKVISTCMCPSAKVYVLVVLVKARKAITMLQV